MMEQRLIKGLLPKSWKGFRDTNEGMPKLPGASNSLEFYLPQGLTALTATRREWFLEHREMERVTCQELWTLVITCQGWSMENKYPDFTPLKLLSPLLPPKPSINPIVRNPVGTNWSASHARR